MAQLFEDVFNAQAIYDMVFFNSKTVLIYPTLEQLAKENKPMYDRWLYQAKKFITLKVDFEDDEYMQEIYQKHAINYPEFSRIVAITYAKVYSENNTLKRYMKKIMNEDEFIVLSEFLNELYTISTEAIQSNPHYFKILTGHNIINHDIPLLIKKCMQYGSKLEKGVPLILKRSLGVKPWESGVVDTVDVWKFNGYDRMPLMLIADFLGLKKTVDLLPPEEVSQKYWELVETDKEKALEFVSLQSATQTNLVIQLMNTLRQL